MSTNRYFIIVFPHRGKPKRSLKDCLWRIDPALEQSGDYNIGKGGRIGENEYKSTQKTIQQFGQEFSKSPMSSSSKKRKQQFEPRLVGAMLETNLPSETNFNNTSSKKLKVHNLEHIAVMTTNVVNEVSEYQNVMTSENHFGKRRSVR